MPHSPTPVRETALRILRRVEVDRAFLDRLLDAERPRERSIEDRSLLQELTSGAVKWRLRLDWVLGRLLHRPLSELTPWIRNILRLGAYQLLFLDRIPHYAVVHESVELAKRYGHRGTSELVNAVLRRLTREADRIPYPDREADPAAYLSIAGSHPEWMVRRWIARYALEEAERLCEANNARPMISIRANTLKVDLETLAEGLRSEEIEAIPNPWIDGFLEIRRSGRLWETEAFRDGWFQPQDPSAGFASLLLAPQPGERILDMCSAPGGKTTHLAQCMRNQGEIVALDLHEGRLRDLEENVRRLGVTIVRTVQADARASTDRPFDRILIDAPCSGLGVLRRRADARWHRREEDIPQLVELQRAILECAARLLRVGGVLVYSTCTIEPEENQGVVDAFLRAREEIRLEPASSRIPSELARTYLHTLPHRHGIDGTFAARMRKTEAGNAQYPTDGSRPGH